MAPASCPVLQLGAFCLCLGEEGMEGRTTSEELLGEHMEEAMDLMGTPSDSKPSLSASLELPHNREGYIHKEVQVLILWVDSLIPTGKKDPVDGPEGDKYYSLSDEGSEDTRIMWGPPGCEEEERETKAVNPIEEKGLHYSSRTPAEDMEVEDLLKCERFGVAVTQTSYLLLWTVDDHQISSHSNTSISTGSPVLRISREEVTLPSEDLPAFITLVSFPLQSCSSVMSQC